MRKSSRGNPYHWPAGSPRGGQFASAKNQMLCNEIENQTSYYEKRTEYRKGEISKEEYNDFVQNYKSEQKELMNQLFGGERKLNERHVVKTDFKPAHSVREAEDYARNLGVKPFYNGMDLDVCNALNKSLVETFDEFPETRNRINVVGNAQDINYAHKKELSEVVYDYYDNQDGIPSYMVESLTKRTVSKCVGRIPSGRYAHYRGMVAFRGCPSQEIVDCERRYAGIYVNEKFSRYGADFSKAVERDVKDGFHPEGCFTIKAVMDHECGHVIDDAYNLSDSISKGRNTLTVMGEGSSSSCNISDIQNGLSEYATANVKEFIAEAWSEYKNNPHPRDIAYGVGNAIKTLGEKNE